MALPQPFSELMSGSRAAGSRLPGPSWPFPERVPSPPERRFFPASARRLSESRRLAASSLPSGRHCSEAVDVDRGQLVWRRLRYCPVVMGLHELSPVGRRAPGGRDGRRFEIGALVEELKRCEFDGYAPAR